MRTRTLRKRRECENKYLYSGFRNYKKKVESCLQL